MYVLSELRNDEQKLRMAITAALEPKPWRHDYPGHPQESSWMCNKCGKSRCENSINHRPHCPIPDPFIGPLEVAAERLVKKCLVNAEMMGRFGDALNYVLTPYSSTIWRMKHFVAWLKASTINKCIVCLLTLGQAREDER